MKTLCVLALLCVTSCVEAFGQTPATTGAAAGNSPEVINLKKQLSKASGSSRKVTLRLKNPTMWNGAVIPSDKPLLVWVESVHDTCFDIEPLYRQIGNGRGCMPYDRIQSAAVESRALGVLKTAGIIGLAVVASVVLLPDAIICLVFHKGCGWFSARALEPNPNSTGRGLFHYEPESRTPFLAISAQIH